jgi:predicted RNA-binding protein YlqC (UPF0109 family)
MDDRDPEAERGLEPLDPDEADDLDDEGFGDEDDYDAPPSTVEAGPDPAERLRELVVYMATALVDDPDGVEVEAERRGPHVHLNLRVPEDELGKVIGRQGRIARAMRTALMIAGARANVRASLDIEG